MVNLRCPVCAGALEKRAGAYLCPKNHSFDIAKSGYVNLLLNSSQGHHGDDKLMVRARRDFLDKGYYDRFIAAVADAAAEFTPPEATVLDAGCGEGIYSLAVLRAIEKAGKHGELLGVDISKTALQYASKRSPDFTLCVASCAHLPVEDGSVDEVLNIFSPFVPEEFARVLKPGGYLLRAYPLREHLWELKALIYDTPRDNPPTPLTTEGFTLVETREVRDIIHLSCNEDILSLFRMTPYYYKTGAKDQQKAEQAQELDANTKSELKLYAGQALSALKSEIVNVVSDKLVKDTVKELMGNKDFMGNFMVAVAKNWASGEDLVISASDTDGLTAYFRAHAKDLLDKGVKIEKVNGKAAAFSVSPSDGSYKVNFGEEEFAAYFKDFLRPKLIEMLF